jgi:WD40 repeat protein
MEQQQLSKYLRLQADNLSPRPLQSLGVYSSLDANILVAGSADKNLRFIEVDTFEEIVKYEVKKKSVNCVTISGMSIKGDDPFIITAGKDKLMQIWDPSSGNIGKDIDLPTTEVLALATYQGTSSLVLIGTKDSKVLLWDIEKNTLVKSFSGHRAGVYAVAITSTVAFSDIQNGNDLTNLIIASGSVDHSVRTWSYATTKRLQKFRHLRSIYSIVITEKTPQPLMVTAGAEYVIRLWDVKTAILLRTLTGHLARVNSLCLWEDYQTLIISGSGDHTLRVHDLITGECLCLLQGHTGDVLTVTSTTTDANGVSSASPSRAQSPPSTSSSTRNEARCVIVSSSEDLSLIQWDLQRIIADFYHSSDENCGLRNDTPPYLPPLLYTPPPENDVGNLKGLSKDERKKLKKDLKRQKLIGMKMKYKKSKSSMTSMGSTLSEGGLEDDDDDEPFVFEALSDEEEEQQKGKKRTLEEEEEEEEESYFMKLLKGEDIDEKEEQEDKEDKPRTHSDQETGIDTSLAQEEKAKLDEIVPPVTTTKEPGGVTNQADATQSRKTSWNRVFPLGHEGAPAGAEQHDDITSKLRRASAGMVHSVLSMIGVLSRENSINKVGVEPLSLHPKHDDQQNKSRGGSVSAPSGTQGQLHLTEDPKSQQINSRVTTPSEETQPSSPRSSIIDPTKADHLDFRHKAQNALTDYHLAQVEEEIEADKRRQEASAKLASRLKRRKTGNNTASSNSSRAISSDDEMVSIKEKKLMQHKLQSNRARQSMLVAKGRAAEALQKRLDEMNQKRLNRTKSNVGDGEEEEDDEDEDGDEAQEDGNHIEETT